MTVGVAAIGYYQSPQDDGEPSPPIPVVVFAADRMLTVGGGRREFEPANLTKAFHFGDCITALVSGDGEALQEVLIRAWGRWTADPGQSVRQLADVIADEFRTERARIIENTALRKWNLSWTEFYSREPEMSEDLRSRMIRDMDWVEPLGSILLGGVDESLGGWGPFIYEVCDPGQVYPANQTGYRSIGIGREHADAVFMNVGYTPHSYWETALLLSYEAKKQGELAAGVGAVTDLWWVTPQGPRLYSGPGMRLTEGLDTIYTQRRLKDREAIQDDRRALSNLLRSISEATTVEPDSQADPAAQPTPENPNGSPAVGPNR